MPFVDPMLAHASSKDFFPGEEAWTLEEKLDGHRLVVSVGEGEQRDLFSAPLIKAWSRDAAVRQLPEHLLKHLRTFPFGVYDGELMIPGGHSSDVTALVSAPDLQYRVFDVTRVGAQDVTCLTLGDRRAVLELIFRERGAIGAPVALTLAVRVMSLDHVQHAFDIVRARGGEGLIVKRLDSTYQPGKRSRDWFKVKDVKMAVVTVIGSRAGKLGPRSVIDVVDDQGVATTVKVKNRAEQANFEANWAALCGRRLVIAYQERTPDGAYRHPRWDHWE